MKKRIVLGGCLAFSLLLAPSCGGDKPGKNGILAVNKMKDVMWDIMQVDEFASSYLSKDSSLDLTPESGKLYKKVFGLHNISSSQFYKSFDFYRHHPAYFKTLLDSVTAMGNRERDSSFYRSRKLTPSIVPSKID